MDGLQGHAPPGRPTHRQAGVAPLRIRQWTRRHAGQTPEHKPHPRARTRATGHPTPQPPAAPAPDTPGRTAPPMDARGHAVHGSRQAVPLPHTHPATRRHTGPPSKHRTPPTPRNSVHTPSTTPPCARIASQHTYKSPDSSSPSNNFPSSPDTTDGIRAARSRPRRTHQMHLQPRGRRNVGTTSRRAPVQGTGHPHRLEPNPHRRTARRMAGAVPGDPATHHRPQADGGTRGSPQGTRPHCRLHLTTHPRGGPPRPRRHTCSERPLPRRRSSSHTAPQIPAACGNPATNRPSPPPQTPVLPTMRTYPVTYNTEPPPRLHTVHRAQHWHSTHGRHRHRTRSHLHARATSPIPPRRRPSQVPPTTSHRMPPLRSPAATTDSPALQPRPLGLPGSRAPPHPLPPLRGPQPPPPRTARGPSRTPPPPATPASSGTSPTLSGPTGRVLRGGRGGPRWAIAVATGNTPLPPTAHPYATAEAA